MPGKELTVQDLIAAVENIRRWAAAVRSTAEAGDTEITVEHWIATQKIIETWAESVRDALKGLKIVIFVDDVAMPLAGPFTSPSGCGSITMGGCDVDIRNWLDVDFETS